MFSVKYFYFPGKEGAGSDNAPIPDIPRNFSHTTEFTVKIKQESLYPNSFFAMFKTPLPMAE